MAFARTTPPSARTLGDPPSALARLGDVANRVVTDGALQRAVAAVRPHVDALIASEEDGLRRLEEAIACFSPERIRQERNPYVREDMWTDAEQRDASRLHREALLALLRTIQEAA